MRIAVGLLMMSLIGFTSFARADGEGDNHPESVRRIPKLGIEVSEPVRKELRDWLKELNKQIDALRAKKDPRIQELLPDVIIFARAVDEALTYQEFFREVEVQVAQEHLLRGLERAKQLANGDAPWTKETGLVVRGYVSKLDGSVQPYGLIVPDNYQPDQITPRRLDIWFHGRGETLSENNFLDQRLKQKGYYAPKDAIVLHPYGRYSNAFKFAGEVDVLEALAAVKRQYRIDEDRISVRGFSMGGAGCWQFAVHYAGDWFAANPGAGFAETPEFLKFFQKEELHPTSWETKTLASLRLHRLVPKPRPVPDNCLQRRERHPKASRRHHGPGAQAGTHAVDPHHRPQDGTPHRSGFRQKNRIAHGGPGPRRPPPRAAGHQFCDLHAEIQPAEMVDGHGYQGALGKKHRAGEHSIRGARLTSIPKTSPGWTSNFGPGEWPFEDSRGGASQITIDGQTLSGPKPQTDRSLKVSLFGMTTAGGVGKFPEDQLRKRHDLQGPIDDAMMDSFVFVKPTGTSANSQVGTWADAELIRAVEHWRRHFRGHARVKNDADITADDIKNSNLILWGDPQSNQILKKIADKLPIAWTADSITVGDNEYPAKDHALVAIYPNPLNPQRYVVLNSSFTFRDYAYLNNARQVPMLPDWAVVDLKTPPGNVWPGKITQAGFFDEAWQLKAEK